MLFGQFQLRWVSNVNGVTGITYRPMDMAMSGWTSYNGLTNTITYDSDLRPTGISTPNVENLAFNYDNADRIIKITNGMNGSNTQTLGYDALDRLTTVTSGAETASYTYDADSNRTHQVYNGTSTSTTFTYASTSNRLNSATGGVSASYGYNAYGSTTTLNGLAAYTYDPFGRLSNAGGAGFLVSAEDQRLRKTSAAGTTYFAPDAGGAMLAESLNGTWYDYVWLNGRLVTVIANGGVFPVHADQTGRPLALTHPTTKAILWQAAGLAFNRNVTQNNWGPFNVGFPGQYWDSEDGLWQNGFRDYDATTGRYIESNPIGLAGGVNTYTYAGNNPITMIDPSGLLPDTALCAGMSAATCHGVSQAVAGDYSYASFQWYVISINFAASGDKIFAGGGITRNYGDLKDIFKLSFSAGIGILLDPCKDSAARREKTDEFLAGFSQSAGGYYLGGGEIAHSPGNGFAIQLGVGWGGGVTITPGVGMRQIWPRGQ